MTQTQYDIIKAEIRAIEQKYLNSAMDIISDYKNENKTKIDYKRRQIYELLQNADDCYSITDPHITVKIELRGNLLIIQNTGIPFTARGICSLMHTDASSKYEGTIGCKGLGFRSVLNWAKHIVIYTKDFFVDFSEQRAKDRLEYYKEITTANFSEELARIDRTAILTAAEVYDSPEEIKRWLDNDFSTSIVLDCEDEYVEEIKNQLLNLKFEELLFLKHINNIFIKIGDKVRKIESIKTSVSCTIQEEEDISEWRLWERSGEIVQKNGTTKKYELIIAYNEDEDSRSKIREEGVLYSYFKTDIPMSFPFLIHGTFELTSERNSLVKDNELNMAILEHLVEFIGEVGESLAKNDEKCDYEALKFLLPDKNLGQLDREYKFSEKLKAKIKEYKILPTIKNEYISIKEDPKYSELEFDKILFPETFTTLLKKADEEFVEDFLRGELDFYSSEEATLLINKDSEYYVHNNTNCELIALYYEQYLSYNPFAKFAPQLFVDSKGDLITGKDVKIFTSNSSQRFDLPNWSKMHFINSKLEKELTQRLQIHGRIFADKLKAFNVVEYSFNRVFGELVAQSKDDIDKTRQTLLWLFRYWQDNNFALPPSALDGTDIRLISRNSEIVASSKCYLGGEYDNGVGERLTGFIDNAVYVGSPEILGLHGYNLEDIKTFFEYLGVKKYPSIEVSKLDSEEQKRYIEYNSRKHKYLFDIYSNSYTHQDFFYGYSKEICVSYVKDLHKIISNANFEDIICWVLDDPKLYECVVNKCEVSNLSVMKGRPYRSQAYREVKRSYMSSWIRMIFCETEWLPTMSGQKVVVGDCTINAHKLTPILEVLDIDYVKLIETSRKSRKEIELLFEKIGIAEDIQDLTPKKIYQILFQLYTNRMDPSITKPIYTKLNLKYKSETVEDLISNNSEYDKFKAEGGVLTELNGKYEYKSVKEAYYVDKKIYSEDILSNYPILVLNKRAGAAKIQKMFCVQPINTIGEINVEFNEHPLNIQYQKEFQRILPYLYAKRLSVDSKNKEFNALKAVKIILVNNAVTKYKISDIDKTGVLQDYELIYKDKIAYIKVPDYLNTVNELKDVLKFRSAVAEVITTVLDVDGDKDAFMVILACKSTKEAEEYFIENGDDNLATVNLAKEKFSFQINREEEFWNAIENAKGTSLADKKVLCEMFLTEFDYDNLNSVENGSKIIKLFKELGINVQEFNQYAFDLIDLQPYYKEQMRQIKLKYREQYLIYLLTQTVSPITNLDEYKLKKQEYDEVTFAVPNSINAQLEKIFENQLRVSMNVLDTVQGNISELVEKLENNTHAKDPQSPHIEVIEPKDADEETDFEAIDAQISSAANNSTQKIELSLLNPSTKTKKLNGKSGGNYDSVTTKTKEKHGFIAECKVYHTLQTLYGESGSVVWVSGNGFRANANLGGDDSLGYDIWYTDLEGNKRYVEVKGSSSNHIEFVLTKNELEFAMQHPDEYEVWYIKFSGDEPSEPYELGNLLKMDEDESFFHNSRFSVESSEFKIRATYSKSDS